MKKIQRVLLFIFLLFFALYLSGCGGGNPFNFFIGKMTKTVEKEKPKTAPPPETKKGTLLADSLKKTPGTPMTEEDSVKILETALGIEYFHYSSGGRRDPFETLFKGRELNVENVKLVGTIWGPKGRFALLKEPKGKGFVIGIGDRIADGRVIDITNKSVTFLITKFGVSSRVMLVLEEKGEKLK